MRQRLTGVLLLLALTACASSGENGNPERRGQTIVPMQVEIQGGTQTVDLVRDEQITTGWIDAPIDDAWRNLLSVYESLGFAVEDLDEYVPAAHRLTVDKNRVRRIGGERLSRYLDCGYSLTAPKADQGQVRVYLSTWLEPGEGGTTISTRFEAAARDTGTSTAAVPCSSRGELEQLIANQLLLRVLQEQHGS